MRLADRRRIGQGHDPGRQIRERIHGIGRRVVQRPLERRLVHRRRDAERHLGANEPESKLATTGVRLGSMSGGGGAGGAPPSGNALAMAGAAPLRFGRRVTPASEQPTARACRRRRPPGRRGPLRSAECPGWRRQTLIVSGPLLRIEQALPGLDDLGEQLLGFGQMRPRGTALDIHGQPLGGGVDHFRVGFEQVDRQQPVVVRRLVAGGIPNHLWYGSNLSAMFGPVSDAWTGRCRYRKSAEGAAALGPNGPAATQVPSVYSSPAGIASNFALGKLPVDRHPDWMKSRSPGRSPIQGTL